MTMTILITTGVWVTFFTLLNLIGQKRTDVLVTERDDLLAALKRLHHISGGWQEGHHAKLAALPETREETLETITKAGGAK